MSSISHPKVILDFDNGRVLTGEDARTFPTKKMVMTRSGARPPRETKHTPKK